MSIYVLRSDNLVKIGFSNDLRKRVQAIISTIPMAVEFVGHMPGDREVEAHLHSVFNAHRFSGEWFVETPAMASLFDMLLTKGLPEIERGEPDVKRTGSTADIAVWSNRIRSESAHRWPEFSHGGRVTALANHLGWNQNRAKDVYYADKRIALRGFEVRALAQFCSELERAA